MWQVFGREQMQYDHVGSPRFETREFWGEHFESKQKCQEACQRLFRDAFPRFSICYPRLSEEKQENVSDDA